MVQLGFTRALNLKLEINEKLKPLTQKHKRFKVVVGGRGSGKSQGIADILLTQIQMTGLKLGCFREFQNSIEDSVHSLLVEEVERLELAGFETQNNVIKYRGQDVCKFRGLARNVSGVKSMHGFDRFWVEEAQTISKDSLKQLTPTLREAGSEIWLTANPMSSADPFSERFIMPFKAELDRTGYYEDDLHMIIVLNHCDNPWFPAELEEERQWDFENLDRAEYDHIWLGAFNDSVENSIIRAEWFDAAIDAHVKLGFEPRGMKIAAHDPADSGDGKGFAIRHGSVVLDCWEEFEGDVNSALDKAMDQSINMNCDLFRWDVGGLGLSLKRQVSQSLNGRTDFEAFNGGSGVDSPDQAYQGEYGLAERQQVTNKDAFKNKRAQAYWMLRDRFYNTFRAVEHGEYVDPEEMISISSSIKDMQALRAQVCRVPSKPTGNGMKQILDKPSMKKLGIESPGMADSLMMLMPIPVQKRTREKLRYKTKVHT